MGFLLLVSAVVATAGSTGVGDLSAALVLLGASWVAAVILTDKYTHKYSYRYDTYLMAAHGKAATVMALALALAIVLASPYRATSAGLWQAFGWFVLADFIVSLPRRRQRLTASFDHSILTSREVSAQATPDAPDGGVGSRADARPGAGLVSFAAAGVDLEAATVVHIRKTIPGFHDEFTTTVVKRRQGISPGVLHAPGDLVVSVVPVNDVRRINPFLIACGDVLKMGGHLVCCYEPIEARRAAIQARYGFLFPPAYALHFLWHRASSKIPGLMYLYFGLTGGRNRVLSKAEVWGRLSYCGFKVIAEETSGPRRWVTARRVAAPIRNRKPSYYPVVGLSKVGLDGELLQTHKVRSMYPYSEFLQKQIFEDNGLSANGKFKNDFRMTEYGRFLRRYWIDELPQIYDWLRGDIKLVGMRATSPHFLSLYPRDFIELYVRIKPGLIPPLFDERTAGFEEIVQTEFTYLRRYAEAPIRTDLRYFWETFRDIVFRGVRSK